MLDDYAQAFPGFPLKLIDVNSLLRFTLRLPMFCEGKFKDKDKDTQR
jgi:hypothetical protein